MPRKVPPKSSRPIGAPPNPAIGEALRLVREDGLTPEEAAAKLTEAGRKISFATIYRGLRKTPAPAPPTAPTAPESPATDKDRQVDALVAKSRTWRRVCAVLGDFARENPAVAPLLAAKLRSLNL